MKDPFDSNTDRERDDQERRYMRERDDRYGNQYGRSQDRGQHFGERQYSRRFGSERFGRDFHDPWNEEAAGRYQSGEGYRYGSDQDEYQRNAGDWGARQRQYGQPANEHRQHASERQQWNERYNQSSQPREADRYTFGERGQQRFGSWEESNAPYDGYEGHWDQQGESSGFQPPRQQSPFAQGAAHYGQQRGYPSGFQQRTGYRSGYGYGGGGAYSGSTYSRGRPPKGYTRSDERVREDICERLTHHPFIDASEVTVQVKDGQVTLEGTVRERGMKHEIEDLAENCSGVNEVNNKIRVARDHSGGGEEHGYQGAMTGTHKTKKHEEK